MKAQELRIGNWINYKWFDKTSILIDGYPRQKTIIHREVLLVLAVDGENKRALIKTKQHRKNQTWVSLCKLTPIPITEEILLKCGFEHVSSYKDYWLTIECDLRVEVSLKNDGRVFTSISDTGLTDNIKHIHQLQNLYFSLTGEELEINL